MLAFRTLARAAPRALPRLTPAIARTAAPTAFRAAGFSTYRALRAVDKELSAKLDSEMQFEAEVAKEEQVPGSIRDFLDQGKFQVVDVEGKEEVKLVRESGNEKITVSFSVTELPYQDEEMMDEDQALDDADPEHTRSPRDEDAPESEEDYPTAPPTHLTVVVEKPSRGPGALAIECTAQDGAIIIDNVHHYSDVEQAFASTPEASHARVDAYPGPSFSTLDEDLQVLMEQYLEERGIGEELAAFVPDYVDFKEQKEYQRWLKNVKTFVDM